MKSVLGLMDLLREIANRRFDGHLTIMKFTTNWRVGFGTPDSYEQIAAMPVGKTFEEAADAAIKSVMQG